MMKRYDKNEWVFEAHFILRSANDRQLANKRFKHINFGSLIPAAGKCEDINTLLDILEYEFKNPGRIIDLNIVANLNPVDDLETVADMESIESDDSRHSKRSHDSDSTDKHSDDSRQSKHCKTQNIIQVNIPTGMTETEFHKLLEVLNDKQKAKSILTLLDIN